jgi:uncharacterized protein (UPF0248 family)
MLDIYKDLRMKSGIRELLNQMKWHSKYNFDHIEIWFVSRGSPGTLDSVRGSEIVGLEPRAMQTAHKWIPYHRVVRIDYAGQTIFEA